MFDQAFNIFAAFGNLLFLVGALMFLGFGGVIMAGYVYPRLRLKRYSGTIVGLVSKKSEKNGQDVYYPVIEYTDNNGTVVRATSNCGSSLLSDKKTGKTVTVLVDPKDPENIQQQGLGLFIFGLIFAAPGIFLGNQFLKSFEYSPATLIAGALLAMLLAFKGKKFWKSIRREKPLTPEEFQDLKRAKREEEKKLFTPILSESDIAAREQKTQVQNLKVAPYVLLIGLALSAGGAWLGCDHYLFMATAKTVQGHVADIKEHHNKDGYTYSAVGEFETEQGTKITFDDKFSSSASTYERGDEISVLYDPKNPHKAIIDRQLWNWVPSAALMGLGLLLLFSSARSLFRQSRRTL